MDMNSPQTISQQCELLGLARSSLYYEPQVINEMDFALLNRLDELYTQWPFYGSRRLTHELKLEGNNIGRDKVRSLMRVLGVEAIYAKPNLSKPNPQNKIFPYLLRGIEAARPNHIWSTDITYVRLFTGFIYLIAVIDWYSRYVIAWRLSPNLEVDFCYEAIMDALTVGNPEYFNVDQGAQFTSPTFYQPLLERGIRYSMDGRGRYLDNIFVERLWRSVKQENIYISGYSSLREAQGGLEDYFDLYNMARPHQSLGNEIPYIVYTS